MWGINGLLCKPYIIMFSKWISTASSAGLSSDEKDGSSAENLLLSSSLEENRDAEEWTRASPPSRRSHWLWTILNILLFLFSLSVLLHQAYQKHAEARVKNGLLKKTSFFCKSPQLSHCVQKLTPFTKLPFSTGWKFQHTSSRQTAVFSSPSIPLPTATVESPTPK